MMKTQYFAVHSLSRGAVDAAESQISLTPMAAYLLPYLCRSFPTGYARVCNPQKMLQTGVLPGALHVENKSRDRRLPCRKPLRASVPCPCLPSWQPVAAAKAAVTSKNSWSLTRFRSRLSRPSAANTTKAPFQTSGQAFAPVRFGCAAGGCI